MANLVTQIIIRARDEASGVFGSLQAKAAAVGAAIAGYFTGRLFGDAISSARDFETAMSAVQAAAGASGDELAALRAAAEEAGATTQYSSVEAAGALENLAKAGLSATEAVKALPAVLDLAAAGGVGLGEASDYIAKAVAGMGLSFAEAGRVADVLAMGANASNTSVDGLAQALSYAAPLANSLGLSLEQTVAMLGKFADAGIDASRAGTALNAILAQFSDPASQFRKELAAAGITTGNFDQALRQLAAAGPEGQRAINAVGTEAGPALRALLNQGIGALDALKAKLDDSAGSAASFASVMNDNLGGATKSFRSAWDALLISLGAPVLDTLKNQLNAVSERLRGFVTDGTAEAFGNAIKAAFESAGQWVQAFVSKVDFKQLAADMQAFAARTAELFAALGTQSGEVARNASIAFGVMSTSLNTILAAVYKVGEAFAGVGSNIVSIAAGIAEAFSKITFGAMSASFAAAAEEIRIAADGLWATSEAFAQQSSTAFERATADALRVREAWAGVGAGAAAASAQATDALEAVEMQAGLTADQVAAMGKDAVVMGGQVVTASSAAAQASAALAEKAKAAAAKQQQAAQATIEKIAELRAEYERAINAGDTQRATAVLIELQAELGKASAAAKTSATDIEQAFQHLGITSQAELERLAVAARRSFETIRDSGTATPSEIQKAFAAYAEKAIAANDGVASSALTAEGSIYKVRIEADAAGKTVVSAMDEGTESTKKLDAAMASAADTTEALGNAAEASGESMAQAAEKQNAAVRRVSVSYLSAADAASEYADEAKRVAHEVFTSGQLVARTAHGQSGAFTVAQAAAAAYVAEMERLDAKQQAFSSNAADGVEALRLRLIELNGTEEEIAKARKARDMAGVERTIELARLDLRRAELRGDTGEVQRLQKEISLLQAQLGLIEQIYRAEARQHSNASAGGGAGEQPSAAGGRRKSEGESGRTGSSRTAPSSGVSTHHTVTVQIGGRSKQINTASAADATGLVGLLQQLETDAMRA